MHKKIHNCRWLDENNKCWYWMPDSKMSCGFKEPKKCCDYKEYKEANKESENN